MALGTCLILTLVCMVLTFCARRIRNRQGEKEGDEEIEKAVSCIVVVVCRYYKHIYQADSC